MSKEPLIIYDAVYGGFFHRTELRDSVRNQMVQLFGPDVFKQGYSAKKTAGVTEALKKAFNAAGIIPVKPAGTLVGASYATTTDGKNTFEKIQITLKGEQASQFLSLDLHSSVARKIIAKLTECQPGDHLEISAWASLDKKDDGREFVNHNVSLKRNGQEAAALPIFKKASDAAVKKLHMLGVTDKKVASALRESAFAAYFKHYLEKCSVKFSHPA
jgi:hypothetical protein